MSDIRSFFASAGIARSGGKSLTPKCQSGAPEAKCVAAAGKTAGESPGRLPPPSVSSDVSERRNVTEAKQTHSLSAKPRKGSKTTDGDAGVRRKSWGAGAGRTKKTRRRELESSSSEEGSGSMSSSNAEEEEVEVEVQRSKQRLRRRLVHSSSDEEIGGSKRAVRTPQLAQGGVASQRRESEAPEECVVHSSSEEEIGGDFAERKKKNKAQDRPVVTLDSFLKPKPATASKASFADRSSASGLVTIRSSDTQRIPMGVDEFFAEAAAKDLAKCKASKKAFGESFDAGFSTGGLSASQRRAGAKEETVERIEETRSVASSARQAIPKEAQPNSALSSAEAAGSSPRAKHSKKRDAPSPAASTKKSKTHGKTEGVLDHMSREDAVARVLAAGGSVTSAVSGKTDFLVVGSVLEDGRPVEAGAKHRKALELSAKGGRICILTEREFTALLPDAGVVVETVVRKPATNFRDGESEVRAERGTEADTVKASVGNGRTNSSSLLPAQETVPASDSVQSLWVEKHRPRTPEDFLGNGEMLRTLVEWLRDWRKVCIQGWLPKTPLGYGYGSGHKKEIQKPKFFSGGFAGGSFPATLDLNARACLLSGPPGVGKTTAATLASRLAGLQLIEFNASDTRNKSHIEGAVSELFDLCTGGTTVDFFKAKTQGTSGRRPCLLLDEVDGLSGGDRGGSQAILRLIEKTRIPIICTCNDRMNTKVRTLASRCLDLRFEKPHGSVIRQRVQRVASLEGVSLEVGQLERIVQASGASIRASRASGLRFAAGDFRQAIGHLQMLATAIQQKRIPGSFCGEKDSQVMMSAFESAKLLLTSSASSKMNATEALDCFFVDYDMVPLLVQENYLDALRQGTQRSASSDAVSLESLTLEMAASAASSLALMEQASALMRRVRQLRQRKLYLKVFLNALRKSNKTAVRAETLLFLQTQDWSLLPTVGSFCAVDVPSKIRRVNGFVSRVSFPSWLGRNSTLTKNKRLFSELSMQLLKTPSCGGGVHALKVSGYLDAIYAFCLAPLLRGEDPKNCVDMLATYGLRREHIVDHLPSLRLKTQARLYDSLEPKTKAAFTRCFNALQPPDEPRREKPRSKKATTESLKAAVRAVEEEGEESEEDDDDSEADASQNAQSSQSRVLRRKSAAQSRGRGGGASKKQKTTPSTNPAPKAKRARGTGQKSVSRTA